MESVPTQTFVPKTETIDVRPAPFEKLTAEQAAIVSQAALLGTLSETFYTEITANDTPAEAPVSLPETEPTERAA